MRALVLFAVALLGLGCEEVRNPEVCCSNAVECDQFGFDEITPCDGFLVCVGGSCESPTCTTSSDCTSPNTPYCVDTVCVGACSDDESCIGAAGGSHCSQGGSCVACTEDSHCGADAPVCDPTSESCRGCVDDAECPSGMCLAAEGTCAVETEAVFVAVGGVDAGECVPAAPCATVSYGLTKVTTSRRVIRLPGSDFVEPGGIVLDRDVYLDAANTRLQRDTPAAGPVLLVANQALARFALPLPVPRRPSTSMTMRR
jgi:hypothetical protein